MQEAKLVKQDCGDVPQGDGWYVINANTAQWKTNPAFGEWLNFEGDASFTDFGLNIHILKPGQAACMYHRETDQEGFLVLSGECLAIIEGQERLLKPWDYFHCPVDTNHVMVGAGDGPCAVLMIGSRSPDQRCTYPVDTTAAKYGASVEEETPDPRQAYAGIPPSTPIASPWTPPTSG